MVKRFKRAIYFAKAYTYLILEKLALQDAIRYCEKGKIYKSYECGMLAIRWQEKNEIAYHKFLELTGA